MKKDNEKLRIVSTVILSIMVIISLYFMIRLIPLNLKDALQSAADSIPPLEEEVGGEGEIIYYGFASLSIAMVGIGSYFIIGLVWFISAIGIVLGLVNQKTDIKGLRYYNYVLIGLMILTCLGSVVKIILWQCGY